MITLHFDCVKSFLHIRINYNIYIQGVPKLNRQTLDGYKEQANNFANKPVPVLALENQRLIGEPRENSDFEYKTLHTYREGRGRGGR